MNFTESENKSAKRLTGIGAVIFLHLIIAYILMSGLAKEIIQPTEQPIELQIIQDIPIPPPEPEPEPEKPKPVEKPPEPLKVVEKVLKTPEVKQPVEKNVAQKSTPTVAAPSPQVTSTAAVTSTSPIAAPAPAAAPVAATPAPPKPAGPTRGVSQGEAGCKAPSYPRDALMNEEQGEVIISVFVGSNGQVKETKVKRSSGSKTLDKAASKAFGLCTFKPALKDGEPQDSWYDIPYEFVLD